jgi:hypothetical protein
MRIAALVLGILGALLSGLLGLKWLGDASQAQAAIASARSLGMDMSELDVLVRAAYGLLAALALGIAGGVLALKGNGKVAAGALAAGVLLPALFSLKTLLTTIFLGMAALFALFAKPKARHA